MTLIDYDNHLSKKNMIWLEVTNFCNLKCAHCYNDSGPEEDRDPEVTLERYLEIIEEVWDMGFRYIQFIGGEPLFYQHTRVLVDQAIRAGFDDIEIFSNLTIVPNWLFYPEYRQIKMATSFYSADELTHDTITAKAGSFKRTVASIRKLVEAEFDIRAGFIEMTLNAGHFERTRDLLNHLGIVKVGRDAKRHFGRASSGEHPDISELCGHCSEGNLSVDAKGNISGCIMSKHWTFGNVNKSSLTSIFNSNERLQFAIDIASSRSGRKIIAPALCQPYDGGNCQPQCGPACYPQQGCNPCAPRGSNPCNPNDQCSPFDNCTPRK